MLDNSEVHVNIPASNLTRAKEFYTEVLGLTPSAEDVHTVTFATPGGSWFQLYLTAYAGTGKHTIAQWEVADLEAEVAALKERGVEFEHYNLPGLEWSDGIASTGQGRLAWFRDSEGNVMCLDEQQPS